MVNGEAGKGDAYRRVDRRAYDRGWEMCFGEKRRKRKDQRARKASTAKRVKSKRSPD